MKRLVVLVAACMMGLSMVGCTVEPEEGTAPLPNVTFYYQGFDHEEVVADFEEAGFTNVSTEPIPDLEVGLLSEEGEFAGWKINGKNKVKASEFLPLDSEVIIYYHVFEEGAEDTADDADATDAGAEVEADTKAVADEAADEEK